MIEVKGLTKFYDTHPAVVDVSFRAERGEIVGFLGPNGAGKTTTMRMLTCFLPPTRGTATVAGFDIQDDSLAVRSRVGYLPENVPLYPDLSVTEYLHFVGSLKGMDRGTRRTRIGVVMDECGITHVSHRAIGKLSRGYRQRVGLAQALINDPEVLILDEPTVGLDPKQIIEIRELIRGLAGRRTVILSTHILPEVSLLCQRVIIINNGRLITDAAPTRLADSLSADAPVEIVVRGERNRIEAVFSDAGLNRFDFVESTDDVHRYRAIPQTGQDVREQLAAGLVQSGLGLLDMHTRAMTLEDVFVKLVTEEPAPNE